MIKKALIAEIVQYSMSGVLEKRGFWSDIVVWPASSASGTSSEFQPRLPLNINAHYFGFQRGSEMTGAGGRVAMRRALRREPAASTSAPGSSSARGGFNFFPTYNAVQDLCPRLTSLFHTSHSQPAGVEPHYPESEREKLLVRLLLQRKARIITFGGSVLSPFSSVSLWHHRLPIIFIDNNCFFHYFFSFILF